MGSLGSLPGGKGLLWGWLPWGGWSRRGRGLMGRVLLPHRARRDSATEGGIGGDECARHARCLPQQGRSVQGHARMSGVWGGWRKAEVCCVHTRVKPGTLAPLCVCALGWGERAKRGCAQTRVQHEHAGPRCACTRTHTRARARALPGHKCAGGCACPVHTRGGRSGGGGERGGSSRRQGARWGGAGPAPPLPVVPRATAA